MTDDIPDVMTDDEIKARLALGNRFGDPHDAKRLAEMARGRQVLLRNHGMQMAQDALSAAFNPDHVEFYRPGNEGASPSPENKEYRKRMQAQVREK